MHAALCVRFVVLFAAVADWDIQDVVFWLEDQNLDQYAPTFAQNEISGVVLLDLSLTDLDYLGVSILGHRKILLRNIEDLRSNGRVVGTVAKAAVSSDVSRSLSSVTTTHEKVAVVEYACLLMLVLMM